jgi:hypothetical protein
MPKTQFGSSLPNSSIADFSAAMAQMGRVQDVSKGVPHLLTHGGRRAFSYALVAALSENSFGITLASGIRLNNFSAICNWPPFEQVLMAGRRSPRGATSAPGKESIWKPSPEAPAPTP